MTVSQAATLVVCLRLPERSLVTAAALTFVKSINRARSIEGIADTSLSLVCSDAKGGSIMGFVPVNCMRCKQSLPNHRIFALMAMLIAASLIAPTIPSLQAQSQTPEKPTLKDFGSSLKRLKWDRKKQAAVEPEQPRKQRASGDEDVVRVTTDLVLADVLVTDKQGRVIRDLTKDDFVISEDGQPQQVSHFSLGSDTNVGRSIVLVIDVSSTLLPYINYAVNAAKVLVNKLGPKDRMAIVTDDLALLVDFTSDKTRLEDALETVKIKCQQFNEPRNLDSLAEKMKSETKWWKKPSINEFKALFAAARELFDEEDTRPIIIFQTRGEQIKFLQPPDLLIDKAVWNDVPSFDYEEFRKAYVQPFSLADVVTGIEKSRATVYSVVPGSQLLGLSEAEQWKRAKIEDQRLIEMFRAQVAGTKFGRGPGWQITDTTIASLLHKRLRGQSALAQISKASGGWISFLEQPEQASAIYAKILSDINNRYVVGYYPTNKVHDGKRRKVSVEVRNHPEYIVWGRKSYIAAETYP